MIRTTAAKLFHTSRSANLSGPMSALGQKRTLRSGPWMSALGHKRTSIGPGDIPHTT